MQLAAVANQSYMLDMAYEVNNSADLGTCKLTIQGDDLTTYQLPCSKSGLQHAIFGLYATETGPYGFLVQANVPFTFHNVTITHQ